MHGHDDLLLLRHHRLDRRRYDDLLLLRHHRLDRRRRRRRRPLLHGQTDDDDDEKNEYGPAGSGCRANDEPGVVVSLCRGRRTRQSCHCARTGSRAYPELGREAGIHTGHSQLRAPVLAPALRASIISATQLVPRWPPAGGPVVNGDGCGTSENRIAPRPAFIQRANL